MNEIGKGYVHIYTGNGKGKTTAAFGLALRAAGCGLRTTFVQFMKGRHYSEIDAARMLGGLVTIEQYGDPSFCTASGKPREKDVILASGGVKRLVEIEEARSCEILVADEAITAVLFGLVEENDILEVIAKKPDGMELVLTGRGAGAGLIDAADLVTEMEEIKHYYTRGVLARRGVEC